MSSWTRAHDAWIARECEGLEVDYAPTPAAPEFYACFPPGKQYQWRQVPNYLTDPAAAIRAAEAWAAKDSEYRSWTLARAGTLLGQCMDDGHHYIHEGEAGLAWSLYDATGGPA